MSQKHAALNLQSQPNMRDRINFLIRSRFSPCRCTLLRLLLMRNPIEEALMQQYICDACGWIYDPAENNDVAFEDLPDDFVCPECGVGKDMFSPVD